MRRREEIKFADDPEHLAVFHYQERIEIVLLEQSRKFEHCSLPRYSHDCPRHKLFDGALEKAVHRSTTARFRFLHCLDFFSDIVILMHRALIGNLPRSWIRCFHFVTQNSAVETRNR